MYLITSFSRKVNCFGLRVWGMVRGGWGVNLSNETTMTLSGVINMPSTFISRKENNHFTTGLCGGEGGRSSLNLMCSKSFERVKGFLWRQVLKRIIYTISARP